MKLIAYMKCSTCRRAYNYLKEHNKDFVVVDIKENTPTIEDFKTYLKLSNKVIKKFFNTSGLVYKELKLKGKIDTFSLDEKLELLTTYPMLIKRPILITNDKVLIGFNEEEYKNI